MEYPFLMHHQQGVGVGLTVRRDGLCMSRAGGGTGRNLGSCWAGLVCSRGGEGWLVGWWGFGKSPGRSGAPEGSLWLWMESDARVDKRKGGQDGGGRGTWLCSDRGLYSPKDDLCFPHVCVHVCVGVCVVAPIQRPVRGLSISPLPELSIPKGSVAMLVPVGRRVGR